MSLYAYLTSRELEGYEFHALLMAAMRKADGENLALLQEAFPEEWDELKVRYNAPGGLLPGEDHADRPQTTLDDGPELLKKELGA